MPVDVVVGERDAKFRALGARMAGAVPDARAGRLGRRPRPAAGERPARVASAALRSTPSGSRRARRPALERLDAEPGPVGTAISPSRAGSGFSRSSNSSSVARPQCGTGPREASAAAACSAGGDAERAVERRGEVDLGAGRAHERRRGEQAARCRRSARSSGRPRRRRPRRARRARRPSRRSRRAPRRARAPRASPCRPWTGSSTSSRPAGASASIARTASSTSQAPLASRRSATCGPGRRAHRGDAAGVVADADLQLHAVEARAPRRARPARRTPARSSAGDRRVDRHARAPARRSAAPRPACPRARPARSHSARSIAASACGRSSTRAAGVEQLRAVQPVRLAPAPARSARAPLPTRSTLDAVVGLQRRGLAVADRRRPRRSATRAAARARTARRRPVCSGARQAQRAPLGRRASRADAAAGEDPGGEQQAEDELQRARLRQRAVQRRAVGARAHDARRRRSASGIASQLSSSHAVIEPNSHGSGAVTKAPASIAA